MALFRKTNKLLYSFLLAKLLFCSVCFAEESPEPAPIFLGMSTALSGPTAELGTGILSGVTTAIERANRAGGIKGRKLELIALDDGYEPRNTGPNMRQLVEEKNVLAIIGNVGTPTAIVSVPIANSLKTPLFAPVTGSGVARRSPQDRYVINFRASYAEEIAEMVDKLITVAGLKPMEIAFFTQRDSYGDSGFSGGLAALNRYGLDDEKKILHTRYERNSLAIENALADIFLAETLPRAVIMVGAYAPCAKFIKLAKKSGLNALFLNVSFTGSAPLARLLGEKTEGVINTQVVPHPLDTTLPIVRDYHDDLKRSAPERSPSFLGLEGYISARILIKALKTVDGEISREALVDALEGLGEFDMGLGTPLYFSSDSHQASHHVWPTILAKGTFVPFDWNELAAIMEKGSSP